MNIFIFCNNDYKYKNIINNFCYCFSIFLTNISNVLYISQINPSCIKNKLKAKSDFKCTKEISNLKKSDFNFNLVFLDDFITDINLNCFKKDIILLFLNFDLFDECYFFEYIKKITELNLSSKNIIFIPVSENKSNDTVVKFEFFKNKNLIYINPIYFNTDNWNNIFNVILKKIQNI